MNRRYSIILISLIILCNLAVINIKAETRTIKLSTPFPKIEFAAGQKIRFKIDVENTGSVSEILDISAKGPSDWEITMKSDLYQIKSIYVDVDEKKTFTFEANAPQGEAAGNYTFSLTAISRDKVITETLELMVELPVTVTESGLTLTASYPSLEGAVGENFEFRVNVINKANQDKIIFFTAEHPENWDVNFKPRFGSSVVRSLEFLAGENDVIVIDIAPPPDVEPGNYDVTVFAETDEVRESLTFNIFVIGSYSLNFRPSNNRVSFDVLQGKPQIISLNITNTGSAPLEKIILFSQQATDWDVNLEYSEIPFLESSASRQVRVSVTPPADTIPGDYVVTLYCSVQERGISETLNYRATVKGSSTWGFLGIGLIAVLAILLALIIMRLGRR
jgi:uncharacterized membrane protein